MAPLPFQTVPPLVPHRNKTVCGLHTVNLDPMQVTIEPQLWLEARVGRGVSAYLLAAKAGGC
jgi:hypothetical protein